MKNTRKLWYEMGWISYVPCHSINILEIKSMKFNLIQFHSIILHRYKQSVSLRCSNHLLHEKMKYVKRVDVTRISTIFFLVDRRNDKTIINPHIQNGGIGIRT